MKFTISDEKHPLYDAYRIIAAQSSSAQNVSSGDLGGYVSKKENLDENSNAWIFGDSVVLGDSVVSGNTKICDGAILNNVNVSYDSMISTVPVSDITFGDKIRIYGTDHSIVIADKNLAFGAVSAKRYNEESKDVHIGYSQFIGSFDKFEKYIQEGKVSDSDAALLEQYIPIMRQRFEN